MVGGFLVSYRLEGELNGASSTEVGTASGCEGLVMEPYTGATLSALGRPEGDEVLAHRVFSMADLERFERGWPEVHAAWAQTQVLWKWYFGLASILHQMEVFTRQMTGVK